ncbi:MAG TPA: hypothetical protein VGO92_06105 [Acidimicrobiales bacterium]|jgi:phenylacetate-CoA ligase|nr:hypothetical protein [Acidimicrobiales bacterium]
MNHVRRSLYSRLLAAATPLVIEPVMKAPYYSVLRWRRRFDQWTQEERDRWRDERLAEVLAHARAHTDFYRERGDVPLAELPIVDKHDLRDNRDRFLADDREAIPTLSKGTSGSSGDPFRYPLDRLAWAHMYAAKLRFLEQAGFHYGERIAVLGTPPALVGGGTSPKARLRRMLERQLPTAEDYEVGDEAALRKARAAESRKAALWYGYAGSLVSMADAALATGAKIRGPRLILSSAERMEPDWPARITAAFGCPVVNQYGANDGGLLSQQCEEGRFHLAQNLSFVEVVDGEVVVTNLHQRSLPFIRYRIGDQAVLGDGPCPCGVPGPTLASMEGRTGDRLHLPDRELSALSFHSLFLGSTGVRRFQVVQDEADHVKIRLETLADFTPQEEQRILDYARTVCGPRVRVEVVSDEALELTPAGKLKMVVRHHQAAH